MNQSMDAPAEGINDVLVRGSKRWYDIEEAQLRPMDFPRVDGPMDHEFNPIVEFIAAIADLLSSLGYLTASVLVILFIGILVYVFVQSRRRLSEREPLREPVQASRSVSLPSPLDLEEGDLLELARRYRVAGDMRRAFAHLFGYVLLRFDERQVLRLGPAKTNYTYRKEVRDPVVSKYFARLVEAFEVHFFGPNPGDFKTWDQLEGELSLVESQLDA